MFHSMKGKLTASIFNINTVAKTFALIEHHIFILYQILPGVYIELSASTYARVKIDDHIIYLPL